VFSLEKYKVYQNPVWAKLRVDENDENAIVLHQVMNGVVSQLYLHAHTVDKANTIAQEHTTKVDTSLTILKVGDEVAAF
jgi:hypothetical protein